MRSATLPSSLGSEKGRFTGGISSWCSRACWALRWRGFLQWVPCPMEAALLQEDFSAPPCPPKPAFSCRKPAAPYGGTGERSGSKSWRRGIRQGRASLWRGPVGTSGELEKAPPLYRVCNEGLHACLCSRWSVRREKNTPGSYWSEGRREDSRGEGGFTMYQRWASSQLAYPAGCRLSYRAASVPIPGGHQPPQTLAAGFGLLRSKPLNAALRRESSLRALSRRYERQLLGMPRFGRTGSLERDGDHAWLHTDRAEKNPIKKIAPNDQRSVRDPRRRTGRDAAGCRFAPVEMGAEVDRSLQHLSKHHVTPPKGWKRPLRSAVWVGLVS